MVIKNDSNEYYITVNELFFTILNPQNIPDNEIFGNIIIYSDDKIYKLFYMIIYEKFLDNTSLALFI
jgi:hypothetical protein